MATSSSIVPLLKSSLYDLYVVNSGGQSVETIVTRVTSTVDTWVNNVRSWNVIRFIGLDIEWRPNLNPGDNNPVATLQLCSGKTCLIFQLLRAQEIPISLAELLADPSFTFVGVGVGEDGEKLMKDHGLRVRNVVDLRYLAAVRLCREDFGRMGLKALAKAVLQWDMEKPKNVTLSRWDDDALSDAQIQYACIDALVSFELGRAMSYWTTLEYCVGVSCGYKIMYCMLPFAVSKELN
ncbi:hypothetical protein SLEP1_g8987 [Rubroshorea leprosula]|uniref:3'-5' exonuclease domain-containing protein n=1 Tax=Rubroshorea leprosula TaxID=152421 RepID=A0AAV5IBW1_9ROSI|nr:hypothetical protein SLEP1_g8987 [Rubroshorea leprosula]